MTQTQQEAEQAEELARAEQAEQPVYFSTINQQIVYGTRLAQSLPHRCAGEPQDLSRTSPEMSIIPTTSQRAWAGACGTRRARRGNSRSPSIFRTATRCTLAAIHTGGQSRSQERHEEPHMRTMSRRSRPFRPQQQRLYQATVFCHMAELLEEQATEGQTYQATAAAAFNQTTYGGACTRRRNPGHGFEGR